MEETVSAPQKKRSNAWGIGIITLIIGFFAGLLAAPKQNLMSTTTGNTPAASAPTSLISQPPLVLNLEMNGQKTQIVGNPLLADAATGATYIQGDANAKITMIEFGDYRCGYCHLYTAQTMPRILEQYIKTGKVRYIYRDTISVGGNETVATASVAACANEQGKFWDFHNMAHLRSSELTSLTGENLTATLVKMSSGFGMKDNELQACLSSKRHDQKYTTEIELSRRFGVTGTPAFVINGYFFSGALPFEVYQKIFEHFGV